jgi:RNA polymerase sigma-70 factor (ECF subfamily)
MPDPQLPSEIHDAAKAAWHSYLSLLDPLRPALHRYCRRLTGDVWETEDLIQDTLLRGFAMLGSVHYTVSNPRAYLLRIATNLWIDQQRHRALERAMMSDPTANADRGDSDPERMASVRDAGATLLQYLAPQERAAVLLKDVFDMSLEECAQIIGTTTGAVKAALHRGRERLKETAGSVRRPTPSAAVVDRFVERYNARDLAGLLSLMLDSASIEMTGIDVEIGREGFDRSDGWFAHNLRGFPGHSPGVEPRWERRDFAGEPLALVFSGHRGREALTSVMRLETEGDRIARIRVYAFCPDTVREVGEAFGLTAAPGFYSFTALVSEMAREEGQTDKGR